MFDRHPMKSLPPTVEKSDTDEPVTNEVTGLADEMMYLRPVGRADRSKEPNPQRIKPLAGVVCGEGRGGLEGYHQNAQRRRHPIQHPLQDRPHPKSQWTHALHYRGWATYSIPQAGWRRRFPSSGLRTGNRKQRLAGCSQPYGNCLCARIRVAEHPIP
jgi:hypothetical protein